MFATESDPGWSPRSRFEIPLEGEYPHSDPFGSRRTYGGGGAVTAHAGEDFSAPPGTVVRAPAAGTVLLAEPLLVRGNAVILDHGSGVITGYWHMQKLDVQPGQHVEAGQALGEVGSTGLSTGAHLHWEFRVRRRPPIRCSGSSREIQSAGWGKWPHPTRQITETTFVVPASAGRVPGDRLKPELRRASTETVLVLEVLVGLRGLALGDHFHLTGLRLFFTLDLEFFFFLSLDCGA